MNATCRKWMLLLVLPVALAAGCDGAGLPDFPANIELGDSGVVFDSGELATRITARALDVDGQPMGKVLIGLSASDDAVELEPAVATSDSEGRVEFSARTTSGGPVSFQASVDLDGQEVGEPLVVDFRLELGLSVGELEWDFPGGQIELVASVADADGALADVPLRLTSDRPADAIAPDTQDSDASGEAAFEVTTEQSGPAMLSLSVDGLDLPDAPSVAVDFVGPTLSGRFSQPEPGAVLVAPRVGLLWVDVRTMGSQVPEARELVSAPLDEVPALGDSGTFELDLPMQAPAGDLYQPDPSDPDLPDSFVIAAYAIGMYDDLDQSGNFSTGDGLLAMTDEGVLLVYVEGELPDPQVLPGVTLGFQYLTFGEQDEPGVLPLAELADAHDLDIRLAPCPAGPLAGRVTFGHGLPEQSDLRLAVMLIDAQLLYNGHFSEMFNVGNFVDLVSQPLTYTPDGELDYDIELPEPATVYPDYQDLLYPDLEGLPPLGVMVPMIYLDSDHNGVFTNDDNDVTTGDLVVGGVQQQFGYGALLLEWLDGPLDWWIGLLMPGINQGYNLLRGPLEERVEAVVDDNTLQVAGLLEGGWTDLPFRIERNTGGLSSLVMAGDDLATGVGPGHLVTSAAGGFGASVQPGDKLVITNRLEQPELLDLDTAVDLTVP